MPPRQQAEVASPAERRTADREKATGSILIGPACEGILLDWSRAGFGVESNLAMRVGASYPLRWWLGGALRTLVGIVRWSRLHRTVTQPDGDVAPVFRSGFELAPGLSQSAPTAQTAVSCPESESPISTAPEKYSCHRRPTRAEISSEQNNSSGKPGLTRASITIGIR